MNDVSPIIALPIAPQMICQGNDSLLAIVDPSREYLIFIRYDGYMVL